MRFAIALCVLSLTAAAHAQGSVAQDDLGNRVQVAAPAARIVSLAPHVTELLFAAGAGEQVVGTVEFSDYPPVAVRIPRVGSYAALDIERILALRPDLVVGWQSGNGPVLERLRALGLTVYVTEPRRFEDVLRAIDNLGVLAGSTKTAREATAGLRTRLVALQQRYAQAPAVSVFYQVWHQPLMTVGGSHLVTRIIETCGGRNVFAGVEALAPAVGVESVLAAAPEAIVASGMDEARPEWLDDWRRWPQLPAVRDGHLFFIPPDLLQRPTPRLLDGAERLCVALARVREARGQ
ncbi:MAG: cobalamin-binding protein [Hydrogenophaga sp.]